MTFEVSPITEEDFPAFIPPLFSSFKPSTFVAALYPNNLTPEGQQQAINRFKKEKEVHPGVRWLKATDPTSLDSNGKPKIVGVAQWVIFEPQTTYPEVPDLAPESIWPDDEEKEYARQMWESYIGPRRKILQAQDKFPVIALVILGVFPEHRKQGAGSLLMKWGCDLADRMNALCTIEASGMGVPLFEKWGFVLQEEFGLEVEERFREKRGGAANRFMVRVPRGGEVKGEN